MKRSGLNRDHFNPMYQQPYQNLSPSSAVGSHGNVNPVPENSAHLPMRNNILAVSENRSSSVFWDQAAGRFVPNTSRAQGSSQVPGTELTYTGRSIFFGSPALSEQQSNAGTRNNSSVGGVLAGDNTLSPNYCYTPLYPSISNNNNRNWRSQPSSFTTSLVLPMCTTIVHLASPSIHPSPLIGPPMSSSVSDEVATSITAYDICLQPLIGHHQFGRPQSGTLFFIC